MKTSKRLPVLLLITLTAFVACKKHDPAPGSYNSPNSTLSTTKKLTRIGDSTNNNQFQYDSSSKLIALNIVTDSNSNPYKVSYTSGVASNLQSQYFSTNLNFSAGHLIRTEVTNIATNQFESMKTLTYTNDAVTEVIYYEKSVSSTQLLPQLKFDYDVLPGGDISKIYIYLWDATTGQYVYEGRNEYQYDIHANPVYPLKDFYSLFMTFPATPHNVLTEISYDYTGAQISVATYQYTYDSDGNPLKAKRTYAPTGRPQEISTVTYSYQ